MKIYALSDPHLSSSTKGKAMDVFGDQWLNHDRKIAAAWRETVEEEDLVLVAGDISWAMRPGDAATDLAFLAELPGRKILIRGNHDYWWSTASKVRSGLPEGISILQNDAWSLGGLTVAGTRLWVDREMGPIRLPCRSAREQPDLLNPVPMALEKADPAEEEARRRQDEKILLRELNRLELALAAMDPGASLRIVMVHYPPIATDMKETRASRLIEGAGVHHCVFGHLHDLVPSPGRGFYGERGGVTYHLTSCDYLDFIPALIAEV